MADLDNDKVDTVEIGVVGSGSMGGGMTLLFSEKGRHVGFYDYDKKAVERLLKTVQDDKDVDNSYVHGFTTLQKLVDGFSKASDRKARIIVLSLPHGKTVDKVADDLLPLLEKGDIVIDGGNEWWEATEARQRRAAEKGIEWVGMGVSGGYQAARRGPSMSPGCTPEAWEIIKPYLETWVARTPNGEPCVLRMGPGGAGHYVKMMHNGIEHAHLSILCEVRGLLHYQLGMSNDDIADLFARWHKDGPLRGNYLVGIGYKGLRFKHGDGIDKEEGIVEGIEDKVTQDVDQSEGTGTWSTGEIARRHVAAPSISAAHQLRVISANRDERLKVVENLQIPQPNKSNTKPDEAFCKQLEQAVYGAILGGFVQGLELITRASTDQNWDVTLKNCLLIWRAGCIIQSDAITEFLLPLVEKFGPSKPLNLLRDIPEVAKELQKTYGPMKDLYRIALDTDAVAPALGATVEWLKAVGGKDLPTDFEEMELDYFGHHNYDIKGKPEAGHEKGAFHTEFAPA